MTEGKPQPLSEFHVKRLDKDGTIVGEVKIQMCLENSVDDLMQSSRDALGFSQNDSLVIREERSKQCIERTLGLEHVDYSESLIIFIAQADESAEGESNKESLYESDINNGGSSADENIRAKDETSVESESDNDLSDESELITEEIEGNSDTNSKEVKDENSEQYVSDSDHSDKSEHFAEEASTESDSNFSKEVVEERITTLLGEISDVDGVEYDVADVIEDINEFGTKYEYFESEEERIKHQENNFSLSETSVQRDDEPSISPRDGIDGKSTCEDADPTFGKLVKELIPTDSIKSAKLAIVTKTIDLHIKRCKVNARLNDSIAKKLQLYLSNIDYNETDVRTCAEELDGILKDSFQSCDCDHDSQIVEGTFMLGGRYRVIATATSSEGTELNILIQKALETLEAHDRRGDVEDIEKEDVVDSGESEDDLATCRTEVTYEVDPEMDTMDFTHFRDELKESKNWRLFPENLSSVSVAEIRSRDRNIELVADVISYDEASVIERSRIDCLWDILRSSPSLSNNAGEIWQRLRSSSTEDDIQLEKLRLLVNEEMMKTLPELDKALNILELCRSTSELIGIDGSKSVALSLFGTPSFQPFLIKVLECDENDTNEQRDIFEDKMKNDLLIHLDQAEIELDPFFQTYLNHNDDQKHNTIIDIDATPDHILHEQISSMSTESDEQHTEEPKEEHEDGELMTYQDLFVDRPYHEGSEDLSVATIIDRLKFRTDVFRTRRDSISSDSESGSSASFESACGDFDSGEEEEEVGVLDSYESKIRFNKSDPFHVLLEVLKQGNLSVRQEVFRRLLEQRYSVPIFFQYSGEDRLVSLTDALMFSKVKYLKKFRSIDQDKDLPRVVFLTDCHENEMAESLDLASHIFRCRFGSKGSDMKSFSTMCELTVGFLGGQNLDSECPWMVLHVQGDYDHLLSYLQQFSPDVIMVEVDLKRKKHVKFQKDLAELTHHLFTWSSSKCKYHYDRKKKLFVGQFNDIADGIISRLIKVLKDLNSSNPVCKDKLESIKLYPQQEMNTKDFIENAVLTAKIETLKYRLVLQESFKKQGELQRMLTFERNSRRREELITEIAEEKLFRSKEARSTQNQEILLDIFCDTLRTEDEELRFIQANCFEVCLDEQSNSLLDSEIKNVSMAYEKLSESQNPESPNHKASHMFKNQYLKANKEYIEKSVGVENIWRELIHSYESAPLQNDHLPGMAAQYLMDGFVLELLDGDTGILCTKWTNALFKALQEKLDQLVGKEVRVFVLSIMGTQSTGKSTLLNIMFGCRMRVSAGQCTKGVYIQLIKSEFNKRYDYVLILDTEGLRAPEFFGEKWSIWKDNRMATLSVLSADATIITAVNEDDIAIREVVPIVLLAHKRSKIAEESGRQPTKLFFAYNRVDTTNLSKFMKNRQSLHRTLRDAETEMADIGPRDYKSFLASFNTSDDESKSDIKYFGLLNKGGSPPDDTPNFEFGRKVASFREYIEERTLSRTFQSLVEWSEHIQLVYSCMESTNFELSFKSAMEHKAFNEYEKNEDEIKQTVAKAFCAAISKVEGEIMKTDVDPKNTDKSDSEFFISMMNSLVQQIVTESDQKVEELLEQNKFENFREVRKQAFRRFVEKLQTEKIEKIKMTCNGRFKYEMEKQDYQERICRELQKEIDQDPTIKKDEVRQDEIFNRIFANKLNDCLRDYPIINVREQVEDVYANHLHVMQNQYPSESLPWLRKITRFGGKFLTGAIKYVTGKPWSNSSSKGADLLKLESRISEITSQQKSFDIAVVHNIISLTIEATKQMNAHEESNYHKCVKEFLVKTLEKVQKTWEHKHNIAAKLQAEKEVLRDNFKNVICKEIFGKARAIQQISDGLIHAMKNGFVEYLSSKVQVAVQDMGWVMDSKILQAHVDLKYLKLSKDGKEYELINKLDNSSDYYKETVLEKISEFVNMYEVEEWKNLVTKTRVAVEHAGFEASRIISDGYNKMRELLKNELDPNILIHLPELTTWYDGLNEDLHKPGNSVNSNFVDIKDEIDKRLLKVDRPSLDIMACSREVYRLLSDNFNPGARPRCTAVCPRCTLPCNKSVGHYSEVSRHNCDHQPGGLVGAGWKRSNKLVGFSCAESVSRGDLMVFPDKEVPFSEFDKQYPEWMLPSEASATSRVRKYLFQRHNKAIAKYYNRDEPDIDNLNPWITASHEEMVHETLEKTKK